jgi:alpha-D-xyloside xylohydrolase
LLDQRRPSRRSYQGRTGNDSQRRIRRNLTAGKLTFKNGSGECCGEEEHSCFGWPPTRKAIVGGLFKLEVRFLPNDGERFYGLGQQIHGKLNQKGCTIELLHRNTQLSIPFLLSNRGYGFRNVPGRAAGYDCTPGVAGKHQMDYWITVGETPAELRNNTWTPPATPMLPMGGRVLAVQAALRHPDELRRRAQHKRRGLPLSVIVVTPLPDPLRGLEVRPGLLARPRWHDSRAGRDGVKVMVSIWPTVNLLSENHRSAPRLLIGAEYGRPIHMQFRDLA